MLPDVPGYPVQNINRFPISSISGAPHCSVMLHLVDQPPLIDANTIF